MLRTGVLWIRGPASPRRSGGPERTMQSVGLTRSPVSPADDAVRGGERRQQRPRAPAHREATGPQAPPQTTAITVPDAVSPASVFVSPGGSHSRARLGNWWLKHSRPHLTGTHCTSLLVAGMRANNHRELSFKGKVLFQGRRHTSMRNVISVASISSSCGRHHERTVKNRKHFPN